MPIDGLTDANKLPRLGKIRLGEMVQGGRRPFPRAADHFVVPQAVADVFGDTPTTLSPVFFPDADPDKFASTFYRYYTTSYDLTCRGDGETASRMIDLQASSIKGEPVMASAQTTGKTERQPVPCPCPLLDSGQCRPIMNLQIVLPTVEGIGIWQIDTSSRNSIRNVWGCIGMVQRGNVDVGKIAFELNLVKQSVVPRDGKAKNVFVLELQVLNNGENALPEMLTEPVELPPSDDVRPAEITPDPEQIEVADEMEAYESDRAAKIRERPAPVEMNVEKFKKGALANGFGPTWIYEVVLTVVKGLDFPGYNDNMIAERDGKPNTWAALWEACVAARKDEHDGLAAYREAVGEEEE